MAIDTGDPVWRSGLPDSRVAVVAALAFEAASARRAATPAGSRVYVSGPGPACAAATAREAIADDASALVAWGIAGGLAPDAVTGAILVPARVMAGSRVFATAPAWRRRLAGVLSGPRLLDGAIYSSPTVVTTPDEKAALAARTGAIAVDMESFAIAEVAGRARLPFVALRVVADTVADALPDEIGSLVTADGQTRWRGLAALVTRPRELRPLLTLARRTAAAHAALAGIADRLAGTTS